MGDSKPDVRDSEEDARNQDAEQYNPFGDLFPPVPGRSRPQEQPVQLVMGQPEARGFAPPSSDVPVPPPPTDTPTPPGDGPTPPPTGKIDLPDVKPEDIRAFLANRTPNPVTGWDNARAVDEFVKRLTPVKPTEWDPETKYNDLSPALKETLRTAMERDPKELAILLKAVNQRLAKEGISISVDLEQRDLPQNERFGDAGGTQMFGTFKVHRPRAPEGKREDTVELYGTEKRNDTPTGTRRGSRPPAQPPSSPPVRPPG